MNLNKVSIIAEVGVNHNGKIEYAKKLVAVAKKAGADYVKFQTFKTENFVTKKSKLADYQKKNINLKSQYHLLENLELSENQHRIIINFCKKKKIKFLSTPFDIQSLNLLKKLRLRIIKISSGDINNYPLLEIISKFAKKVILSTGMSTLLEIKNAIRILKRNNLKDKDIIILHCTTSYPADPNDVNILAINFLKKKLKNHIGYSDHTLGNEAALAAVSLGAKVIEKHITLNKNLIGPDPQASLDPKEFFKFVHSIRKLEKILGKEKKILTFNERKIKKLVRKSIVAKTNINKGDFFTLNNIICKRPEGGISPINWKKIIGKKAKSFFYKDEFITLL
jgi:N,N'-diacetyllegionaminate synthase